ncbi:MAG TPA: HU family DNA-binding protein [Bryobacteraceae bacterium]|nr:HU family DNA-binding protein [Bryobacteraceae bacterium]
MKKPELARRLARQSGVSKAEAADQLDRVVHQILSNLRKGQPAALPGLGMFTPATRHGFHFELDPQKGRPDHDA